MIGDLLGLGRRFENKPLIYPTLYKTFVFIVFLAVFKVIEQTIVGLWNGGGIMAGLNKLSEEGANELLANNLVVFAAFIPFFAIKELGRVFGKNKLWTAFFQNSAEQ